GVAQLGFPILVQIADIVSTSFVSMEDRRKYWEKETLPGASSLHRCRRKQRCISIIIWESRSASARNWPVVGSASVASNFTAVKLRGEMNVSTAGIVI